MYAVIATGGKQYRVREGDLLDVERLEPAEDGRVALRPVLLVDDDGNVTADRGRLDQARVTAQVVEHRKGEKLTVFTYKAKKRYRRKLGHRQSLTRIRVDEISA